MTAELWLEKRCEHGWTGPHRNLDSNRECPGGSRVRLDPQKVVLLTGVFVEVSEEREVTSGYGLAEVTAQDIIEALGKEDE